MFQPARQTCRKGYIYYACVNFFSFFTKTKLSLYLLDRFSRFFFHQMEGICVSFLIRSSFFDSSRDVAMATNWSRKIGVFYGPIYFVTLPFGNVLQYRNFDFKRLDRMNFSTLCTILVTFGPETSEFTPLTIAPFVAIRQKSVYHAKYLRISWTYLDLLYRFGRHISGDDFPNIRLVVAQETLLWQPVK